MVIEQCKPYHAQSAGTTTLQPADGKSVFKMYYLDIVGRKDRTRYEWDQSPLDKDAFEADLRGSTLEGVGFITAFPHITKVFRFAPDAETVMHVRAFNTSDLSELDLDRGSGWVEFACYAEALIAADEYRLWAKVETVEEYLERWSGFSDGPITSESKLREYWNR